MTAYDSGSDYMYSSGGEEYDETCGKTGSNNSNKTDDNQKKMDGSQRLLDKIDTRRQKKKSVPSKITYIWHNATAKKRWIDIVRNALGGEESSIQLTPFEIQETRNRSQDPLKSNNVFISADMHFMNNFKDYPLIFEFVDFKRASDRAGSAFGDENRGKMFYCFQQQCKNKTEWSPTSDSVNHDELYAFIATSGDYIGANNLKKGIKHVGGVSHIKAKKLNGKYVKFHPILLLLEEKGQIEEVSISKSDPMYANRDEYVTVRRKKANKAMKQLQEFWRDLIVFRGDDIKVRIFPAISKKEAEEWVNKFEKLEREVTANGVTSLSATARDEWNKMNKVVSIEIKAEIKCLPSNLTIIPLDQKKDSKKGKNNTKDKNDIFGDSETDSYASSDSSDSEMRNRKKNMERERSGTDMNETSGRLKDKAMRMMSNKKKHHHSKKKYRDDNGNRSEDDDLRRYSNRDRDRYLIKDKYDQRINK